MQIIELKCDLASSYARERVIIFVLLRIVYIFCMYV